MHKEKLPSWFLVQLSWFYSGVGQFVAGDRLWGLCLIVADAICWYGACFSFFNPSAKVSLSLGFALCWLFIWLFSLRESYRLGSRDTAWRGIFLDSLIPGLGALYCRRAIVVGLTLLLLYAGTLINGDYFLDPVADSAASLVVFVWLVTTGLRLMALTLAFAATALKGRLRRSLPLLMLLIAAATMRWGVVLQWEWQQVSYPTVWTSLYEPRIARGDILHASHIGSRLKTGDLVFIASPLNGKPLLRFVAAVAGEEIHIGPTGRLYKGSEAVDDAPFDQLRWANRGNYAVGGGSLEIPSDHLFLLAPPASPSVDSRSLGPIEVGAVGAKVEKVIWPPRSWGKLQKKSSQPKQVRR